MALIELVGELDATFAWDGERLCNARNFAPGATAPLRLRGAAAAVELASPESCRIVRDLLGINKLFWTPTDAGAALGARPKRLVDAGYAFEAIRAIPRGSVIDFEHGQEPHVRGIDPLAEGERPKAELAVEIRSLLERYLAALVKGHPDARFFVCLSGGLDSSGIAALARERVPGLVAVSFDLERTHGESEDRRVARRLARDLDVPLMCVDSSQSSLLEKLDVVLEEGIDWRDFNVHAGLVNAALAEAVAATDSHDTQKIVLTGDLANEFLADYADERYGGATYYELPRLQGADLRAALVRGLDTSNREVGVFGAWGVDVVQPYAVAVDLYLFLPVTLLESPRAKQDLGRAVYGDLLPEYVYARPKVRAQVGSAAGDGGVLGLCIDQGVDAGFLRDRFAHLHGVRVEHLNRFVRGGTYRSGIPTLPNIALR